MTKVLFEFPKPQGIVVRLTRTTFRGREELHLREWYPKGDTMAPGAKGANIPWEHAKDLLESLTAEVGRVRDTEGND